MIRRFYDRHHTVAVVADDDVEYWRGSDAQKWTRMESTWSPNPFDAPSCLLEYALLNIDLNHKVKD